MAKTENYIKFSNLQDNSFFILDDITYCKFGNYGFSFNNGEKIAKIIDGETFVEPIELKDVLKR
jgi:hypothetical protein